MPPRLVIEVLGDVSHFERSLKSGTRSAERFNRAIEQGSRGALTAAISYRGLARSVAFASATFLGAGGLVAGLKSSVSAASNLNEQTARTTVTFGKSAATMQAWSRTTASAMGLARDQSLEAAAGFGAIFAAIGRTDDESAKLSRGLVSRAADLASFANTSVPEALTALRSGLVGESEPLRRYQIFLTEASVAQEALAQTGKRTAQELTQQEKILARYSLIMKGSSLQAGDFARTSGGLANQQRILSANIRELQIGIGQALIPDVLRVTTAMNDWLSKSENQQRVTDGVRSAVATLRDVVAAATPPIRDITNAIKAFSDAVGGAGNALKTLAAVVGTVKLAQLASGFTTAGVAATRAGGKVGSLRAQLAALPVAIPITIAVAVVFNRKAISKAGESFLRENGLGFLAGGQNITDANDIPAWAREAFLRRTRLGRDLDAIEGIRTQRAAEQATQPQFAGTAGRGGAGARGRGVATLSPAARNALRLAQATSPAQTLAALAEQRTLIGRQIQAVSRQLEGARGTKADELARKLAGLYEDDKAALSQIQSIHERAAADAKQRSDKIRDAAERRRDAIKKAREAIRQGVADAISGFDLGVRGDPLTVAQIRRATAAGDKAAVLARQAQEQARQFRQLGLTSTGQERAPGVKSLRAALGNLERDTKGTTLDTEKMRARFAQIRKVISGSFGAVRDDVRRTVRGMLDDIDQQLKDRGGASGFKKLRPEKLAAVLGIPLGGLSAAQRRNLFANLATLGPNGTVPGSRTAAFAGGGIHIENFHSSAVNTRQLEDDIVKRARGRAYVRRGGK